MNVRILSLFDDEPIQPSAMPRAKQSRAKSPIVQPQAEDLEVAPKIKSKEKLIAAEIQDDLSVKNYYTIGETANKFKVRTSHIRFWTVQFNLKVRTTRKGDRLYTPENIEQLKLIHHLVKEQGFTIAGAKLKMKELKGKNVKDLKNDDIVGALKNLRTILLSLKSQIDLL